MVLPEPEIRARAGRVYAIFNRLYAAAWDKGLLSIPDTVAHPPKGFEEQMAVFMGNQDIKLPPLVVSHILGTACLVHGMISMELSGRFQGVVPRPENFYTSF